MDIVQVLKSWYDVKSNRGLAFNLIKDIVFFSLFFYVGFNANSWCVQKGLPTFQQYKTSLNNSTYINPNLGAFNISLPQ